VAVTKPAGDQLGYGVHLLNHRAVPDFDRCIRLAAILSREREKWQGRDVTDNLHETA
jgi:hypothetical protein